MTDTDHLFSNLIHVIHPIIERITSCGGVPVLVGGCVRDFYLGHTTKDIDIEVFGINDLTTLKDSLSKLTKINTVGRSFQVLKTTYRNMEIDLSLPRIDTKVGPGHKGFDITPAPTISYEQAASRRDFTINSMGYDLVNKELLDPFEGLIDCKKKVLRAVSDHFEEDPLRVFRALQFSARFEFKIDEKTLQRCQKMPIHELSKERIYEEFKKCLLKSHKPSFGLQYTKALGIDRLFTEFETLRNTPQDPEWHPEGSVWEHTLLVVDEMAKLAPSAQKLGFMFAALCHDIGKPSCTETIKGHIRSYGHDKIGAKITPSFLSKITDDKKLISFVTTLVETHMQPSLLFSATQKGRVTDAAIRRLSKKVSIPDLLILAKADHFGRTTDSAINNHFPAGEWLQKRYDALSLTQKGPDPLISGKELMALGYQEGHFLGTILKDVAQQQEEGTLSTPEEALNYIKTNYPLS